MSRPAENTSSDPGTGDKATSKRKRDIIPENEDDKLEIDINLPEPPSKKAKRKEKKQSTRQARTIAQPNPSQETSSNTEKDSEPASTKSTTPSASKHSEFGIWIGNLPYSATKDSVRQFLRDEGGIDAEAITRIHLPTDARRQNKGFAYVDLAGPVELTTALALSERLVAGRRVLIKNAKSFEGRPDKATALEGNPSSDPATRKSPKERSARVFVGNLSFDVTQADLREHFSQAGQVEDVFMATFEDSAKCKGFAWVRFADVAAAENAVNGFVYRSPEEGAGSAGGDQQDRATKATKPRKHFINRIYGRLLRCEFAEDPQTRYKKRFGPKGQGSGNVVPVAGAVAGETEGGGELNPDEVTPPSRRGDQLRPKELRPARKKLDVEQKREQRKERHNARMAAPEKTWSQTPQQTGAIVAGAGAKITFD